MTVAKPTVKTTGMGGIVCAVLMPHAPILVPAVGDGRGQAAAASTHAMREAAKAVVSRHPDSIVLISPHSPRKPGAFGLWSDDPVVGSFAPFGAPDTLVSLPHDRRLTNSIAAEARVRNVTTWSIRHAELDHGALVPLWFLAEAGWTGPVVVASLNYSGEGGLTSFGEAIAAAAKTTGRRIAIVASGDMSHRLTPNAPCGFHPQAHRFDEAFIHLLKTGNYRGFSDMDPDLRELAAEDAVDSTIVAAAATAWSTLGHSVLNYEGPFGVGYGVAILFAATPGAEPLKLFSDTNEMLPHIARYSVAAALRKLNESAPKAEGENLNRAAGVFVTIRHRNGELRGCIGTIQPATDNVIRETWRNARQAAFHDGRFEPVTLSELPHLRFEVSVLHPPEEIFSEQSLNPQRYGVIVSTEDGRRGLLLPAIEGITTVEQQLLHARRKGRIDPEEPVRLERFEVDHFEEA